MSKVTYSTAEFPAAWKSRLFDPSPSIRAEAMREVPLDSLGLGWGQVMQLYGDRDEAVVHALLMNPSLNEEQGEWMYARSMGYLSATGPEAERHLRLVEQLVGRGFPCSEHLGMHLWYRLWEKHTPERKERLLRIALRLRSSPLDAGFIRTLWGRCQDNRELALECLAHPLAGRELWEEALDKMEEKPNPELSRRAASVFARRMEALTLDPAARLILEWGGFLELAELAKTLQPAYFGAAIAGMMRRQSEVAGGEEWVLHLILSASEECLQGFREDELATLMGAEAEAIRLLGIRLYGQRKGAEQQASSEPERRGLRR